MSYEEWDGVEYAVNVLFMGVAVAAIDIGIVLLIWAFSGFPGGM